MDMLDDISKELPTNGLKVADLINAFNARLGYVSTALAQLDRKQDIIESKLEKKLDEQDKALDDIKAVQARAPTRADLAELQAQQMRRETYEVAHQALISQIASILADVIGVKAEMKATEARTAKNVQTADELHRDQDRKSTRLNSSHTVISYAVFCLKKKKQNKRLIVYLTVDNKDIGTYNV